MDDRLVVVASERKLPDEHLVEDDAERPDVRALSRDPRPGPAPATCRPRCPIVVWLFGERRPAAELGQPEVHDLGLALRRDHDVGALDVAVDDALVMGLAQAGGHLAGDLQGLLRLQRSAPELVLERLAVHELHGDIGPVLVLADLVDGADVRVVQGRGGLGLDEETLFEVGRVHEVRRQELQGHRPLELEVLGLVDDPHAAVAELLDDLVLAGDDGPGPHDLDRRLEGFRQRRSFRPRRMERRRTVAAKPGDVVIL